MYTLYYTTRSYTHESTALVARIALEEVDATYEVVEVELKPAPPDWYLAQNPHGKIPSLVDGDIVVYPSAAILFHLADKHPSTALCPAVGSTARGLCYRHMFDMAEMVQGAYMMAYYPARYSTDESDADRIRHRGISWIVRYWSEIDARLKDGPFVLGINYSIADIYLYVLARWYFEVRGRWHADEMPDFDRFIHAAQTVARIESRPAVKRALVADEIEPILPARSD
ncbi:MAG: glutathione S-transferase family protein [Alphaproteobacteria bacterium]|nr:glutathione S-transferase family protein [Alphaproteobacteria bacterium]